MKFYTNKIATGKSANFSDFINKLASQQNQTVKIAEKECPTPAQVEAFEDKNPELLKGIEEACPEGSKSPAESKSEKSDGAKKSEEKESSMDKECCYASSAKMVRIANLDPKTKSEWKAYWKKLYPSAYVDAMFADK